MIGLAGWAFADSDTPSYALKKYSDDMISTLASLVSYPTVQGASMPNKDNPNFKAMTAFLQKKATDLGFDFNDAGAVVVIGFGSSPKRLGLITHGDVQPADPSKWKKGPFTLDTDTMPGRLIARGSEDDKGPIAAALYAMKAVKDRGRVLARRVELTISYTEESDWDPFIEFLKQNPPPDLNVTLDAEYPVVVAEKGWCAIQVTVKPPAEVPAGANIPRLESFTGGAFLSQVPEDAAAVIRHASPGVVATLKKSAAADPKVTYDFQIDGEALTIRARGVSAHSSKPEEGVNAITHLAEVLAACEWAPTAASGVVRFEHDLLGTGYYAERFGAIAYSDPFMGPLTLSLGLVREESGASRIGVNLRRPAGKPGAQFEKEIRDTLTAWQSHTGIALADIDLYIGEPYDARNAPHVPKLLDIFKRFTGQTGAKPISIGGGSHARLVPNGVNFGPVMPGEPYTGHSEHEYIERSDLLISLQMYTALIEELGMQE